MARVAFLLSILFLAACGSALTTPEDIPLKHLPAGEKFVMTLVMDTCSDTCATYDEPSCSVSVDKSKMVIHIDASVGFSSNGVDGCISTCGREILAHCDVPALAAGTYTVKSNGFEAQIFLE